VSHSASLPAATPVTPSDTPRLGEVLVRRGAISRDQLAHALERQPLARRPIGRVIVDLRYATDETVQRAVAEQHGLPFLDLERASIDRRVARVVNRAYARRHRVLPLTRAGATIIVAMVDPGEREIIDELRRLTASSIEVVVTSEVGFHRALRRAYDEPAGGTAATEAESLDVLPPAPRADDLLRRLVAHALAARCSDLHLEMLSDGLVVRYRIDGVLAPPHFGELQEPLDRHAREIVSRIKVLARLDIAERRRPQDGSFRFSTALVAVPFDIRVSILPTQSGESVVMRLLDASRAAQSLAALDVTPPVARGLEAALARPSGILLVTGPTGSGKSTTLYACLRRLHRPGIRILTAEDPVEYVYDGLSQCQVNDDIGNTFARFLRSFLRHDPEVIMIGEIRDEDTARMAFRAAQTGHLLLSTLHTNSAVAALPRLRDLGVEPSVLASSLACVLSQRLVRRLCVDCRRPVPEAPLEAEANAPGLVAECRPAAAPAPAPAGRDPVSWCATGCPACGFSGFRGRAIVGELWLPDEGDAALIAGDAPFDDVRRSAERTTHTLRDDAAMRLASGVTTREELRRVLGPAFDSGPVAL
jgi:type IV pilus assembly protein PilB